jgi:hypothetical protein
MSSVEVKSFANADEINDNFNNAKIEAVNVGGQRIMKLSLEPGWKWSNDIKPTVGTDSCQATHLGVIVSGTVAVKHNDGTEMSYTAGDAYSIAPGHDVSLFLTSILFREIKGGLGISKLCTLSK